jgi:PncC family amidohydrolase
MKIEKILGILRKRHWTIGIMESCTGGALSNAVTNIPGASDVFKCGLVTYCDEAKIKAGVDEKMIKKFGVYSIEVAEDMARKIEGDVGVGVTGNMNDPAEVFVAVRIKDQVKSIKVSFANNPTHKATELPRATEYLNMKNKIEVRKEKKNQVVEKVADMIIDGL